MNGFRNNGNTCYFNSALQLIMNIPGLKIENPDTPFKKAFQELFKIYFASPDRCLDINVEPLLEIFCEKFPQFKTREPHDAQEALLCLMDLLEDELKDIIIGEVTQATLWPGGKKDIKEEFSILLLNGDKNKSINERLTAFESWNVLTDYIDDNEMRHYVSATQKTISKFPKILFISFDQKTLVEVDDILEKYEIIGTIIHFGNRSGGHYVSMIKNGDKWVEQDDETLTESEFPIKSTHHVLMYSLKK